MEVFDIPDTESQVLIPSGHSDFLKSFLSNDWKFFDHESFSDPGAEKELFSHDIQVVRQWNHTYMGHTYVGKKKFKVLDRDILTEEEENILFLQLNFSKKMLSGFKEEVVQTLKIKVSPIVKWHDIYLEVREKLVLGNIGLIFRVAKKYGFSMHNEVSEYISEGNLGLIRAVEGFDISKGYRFSSFAWRVIRNSFFNAESKTRKGLQPEDCLDPQDAKERTCPVEIDELIDILEENRAGLTKSELEIIRRRYYSKETLQSIAANIGYSYEKVRQMQKSAEQKLRDYFFPELQ